MEEYGDVSTPKVCVGRLKSSFIYAKIHLHNSKEDCFLTAIKSVYRLQTKYGTVKAAGFIKVIDICRYM